MNKIDPKYIMQMRVIELKKDIERYERVIDEYIKSTGDAEKEIEAINMLLNNAGLSS